MTSTLSKPRVKLRIKKTRLNTKLIKILKFSVVFNIFIIPLYFLTRNNIYFLQLFTARVVTMFLNITGIRAGLSGLMITVPIKTGMFGGTIDWDCTGWKSILVFIALVVATPTDWKKKLNAWIFIPLLYLANIMRVWFVFFFVSSFGVEKFEIIHKTLWSWGLIAVLLVCWIYWYKGSKWFGHYFKEREKFKAKRMKTKKRKLIYSKKNKK